MKESKDNKDSTRDIYRVLKESSEKAKKRKRANLLEELGIKEYFEDGGITINKRTCRGIECKLCIDPCPTHALFWRSGEVGVDNDLCVYCAACVLSCIVDDCMRVWRKRLNGEVEVFSTPKQVSTLLNSIGLNKRKERVNILLTCLSETSQRKHPTSVKL